MAQIAAINIAARLGAGDDGVAGVAELHQRAEENWGRAVPSPGRWRFMPLRTPNAVEGGPEPTAATANREHAWCAAARVEKNSAAGVEPRTDR